MTLSPARQGSHRDGQLAAHHRLQRGERLETAVAAQGWQAHRLARAMETLRDALLLAEVVDHRKAIQGIT
jgi:hypothetical protein